ncbi:MAG: hypothetical protein NVSMB48_13150 [Marmoricola sp.]
MTRDELRSAAAHNGILPTAYALEGGLPEDRYVLARIGDGWSVYFVERGRRIDELQFDDEGDACDELLLRLLRDPTTRVF